ncbi:MAG: type 1 glutamine amidotransferase domain-containing protein [Candidatus Eisenbacteria bacterium]|nr:type 1 glutamine amidotransferase domain-containing protein [Candidatus Eisenbacteria bacterium]MCC7141863.1 type 1 glutamine amidotransferase domain-containing protein [Candidatus Eisenbacteria bacterium]
MRNGSTCPRSTATRLVVTALCCLVATLWSADPGQGAERRILLVASSRAESLPPVRSIGADAGQIARCYELLTRAGDFVEIASPNGGPVPLEGIDALGEHDRDLLQGSDLATSLRSSLPLRETLGRDYDAIIVLGGHGALWDLSENTTLHERIVRTQDGGGAIAAIAQGVAGLLDVRQTDGAWLLQGRTVTGATDAEEAKLGFFGRLPIALRARVEAREGIWNGAPAFSPNVIVSRGVVTGQNTISTPGVIHFLTRVLERQKIESGPAPVAR